MNELSELINKVAELHEAIMDSNGDVEVLAQCLPEVQKQLNSLNNFYRVHEVRDNLADYTHISKDYCFEIAQAIAAGKIANVKMEF